MILGLSSYATDLNAVTDAVKNSTENSMVVVDEFGKGTATLDGIAILVATIEEFIDRKADCPILLISTHFHSISKKNLVNSGDGGVLKFKMMQSVFDDQGSLVRLPICNFPGVCV